jgi:hypothetical protein
MVVSLRIIFSVLSMIVVMATGTCFAVNEFPDPTATPNFRRRVSPYVRIIPTASPTTTRAIRFPHGVFFTARPVETPAPTMAPASPVAQQPRILSVKADPETIVSGSSTTVNFTVSLLDYSKLVKQVRLQRVTASGNSEVGVFEQSPTSGRISSYVLKQTLLETTPGKVTFLVVIERNSPPTLYSYTARSIAIAPTSVTITVEPAPVLATFTSVPTATATPRVSNDLGLKLMVPEGWQLDESLQTLHGPMNLNTFDSQYLKPGGIVPNGQASIDVTRVRMPSSFEDYIAQELEDSDVHFRNDSYRFAGFTGRQIVYTDQYSPTLAYRNVVVYLRHGEFLYKFFLTYHEADWRGSLYVKNFQQVLNSIEFTP